jgi:hypothetical protein
MRAKRRLTLTDDHMLVRHQDSIPTVTCCEVHAASRMTTSFPGFLIVRTENLAVRTQVDYYGSKVHEAGASDYRQSHVESQGGFSWNLVRKHVLHLASAS